MLLVAFHCYFTVKLRFIQRHIFKGVAYSLKGGANKGGLGTYSAFAAALGTTIGPGNIIGVTVAISTGGPGAVFWMWVCGVLAISTKYAESIAAIRYRTKTQKGECTGGIMYVLLALNRPRTARVWAILCAAAGLSMGCMVPSSCIAGLMQTAASIPPAATGVVMAALVTPAVAFGVKGVAKICDFLVPIMSIGFMLCCGAVMIIYKQQLYYALMLIMKNAFVKNSIIGGGLAAAVKSGVTRGLYSNESGMGSGAVLAAQAGDNNMGMSALAAATTTFWDTVVMCSATGVVFVCSGAYLKKDGIEMAYAAFNVLPYGGVFLAAAMFLFVLATIIGWYCIGDRAVLFVAKSTVWYKLMYIACVFVGAAVAAEAVWDAADIMMALMIFPTLYCLARLRGEINFSLGEWC